MRARAARSRGLSFSASTLALLLAGASPALVIAADRLVLTDVTIIDVEDGRARPGQTVLIEDGSILQVTDAGNAVVPAEAKTVDGRGRFLVPGYWDMHVHSHREDRWRYHYPLFLAHGVLGVRDAGTQLASALVAMQRSRSDPLAPSVVWGSPPLDGPNPVLPFGLGIESAEDAERIVPLLRQSGFDFIKTYDRLSPAAYGAAARAAAREGLRIEGHVPLAMTPAAVATAGHDVIDHLTLVVEACSPGALERVHARFEAERGETDSMALMSDPTVVRSIAAYDTEACERLFGTFAANQVRQVPTLVQARGYFLPAEARAAAADRLRDTTPALLGAWDGFARSADPEALAAGAAVYRRQLAAIREMQEAGVVLMTGTDASSEAWVFAGSSVHDEMALFVAAGLTPLEALQSATLHPLRYVGRMRGGQAIAPGELADLVLLDSDPREDIRHTRSIQAVIKRGQLFDRAALDGLLQRARAAAEEGGT